MKSTDVFIQCLENEGVEYIFGIPGKETLDLVDSISKSKQIQFINVRHEQGAAFMADVYGRLSNRVGVCLSTLGPGATNLVTGIASANLDHSPVVAVVGQASIVKQHNESHQYINIIKLMDPVTKWSVEIKDANTIPVIIRKAFRLAMSDKPGSVVIELPENIAIEAGISRALPVTHVPENVPTTEATQQAVKIISQSQRPFVIVGNGAIRQRATEELQIFVEQLQAPVTHSFMAKGILAKDDVLNFFSFGFQENDDILRGISEADLLIVIGFDFVERMPKDWNKTKIPIIHLDTLPAEVDEHYPVQIELVGNLKETLKIMNTFDGLATPWCPSGNLKKQIAQNYQIEWNHEHIRSLPLTTENILHVIEGLSSEKTIIISDVGAHKLSIARTFQPKAPNRLIISNGFASMGIALPGSIGAKFACPNDPVICITGDGGALMNISEIETARRLGLSFIIIVLNDSVLKLEEQMMMQKFGNSDGVTYGNPDFVQLAQSFGINGVRANDIQQFRQLLSSALHAQKDITLIDVPLNT
ncbi:acetolactate synthase large subunit [Lederbergia lenta]|uniref:acetolactate synthase large subunit n=1 Tax=Lederbergia lenta TaxID=1467 RepID=UPI002041F058|nr:acetolactate synthase large subunit [Lederbergia lenta]MCM3109408.1 acetolactate synthase large subunit [Lederbergia lenta]